MKKIPEVTLDIYGQGMLWQEIEEKIKQLNAQNYIHLKGHQDLQTRFKEYELYLATSEWGNVWFNLARGDRIWSCHGGDRCPLWESYFYKNDRNGFIVPFVDRSHEEVVADLNGAMQKAFEHLNRLEKVLMNWRNTI